MGTGTGTGRKTESIWQINWEYTSPSQPHKRHPTAAGDQGGGRYFIYRPPDRSVFEIPSSPKSARTVRQAGRHPRRQAKAEQSQGSRFASAWRNTPGRPTSCTRAPPTGKGHARRVSSSSPSDLAQPRPSGGSIRSSVCRRVRLGCPLPRVRGLRLLSYASAPARKRPSSSLPRRGGHGRSRRTAWLYARSGPSDEVPRAMERMDRFDGRSSARLCSWRTADHAWTRWIRRLSAALLRPGDRLQARSRPP